MGARRPRLPSAIGRPEADANDHAQKGDNQWEELEDKHRQPTVYPSLHSVATGQKATAPVNGVCDATVGAIIEP